MLSADENEFTEHATLLRNLTEIASRLTKTNEVEEVEKRRKWGFLKKNRTRRVDTSKQRNGRLKNIKTEQEHLEFYLPNRQKAPTS